MDSIKSKSLLLLLLLSLYPAFSLQDDAPVIELSSGKIRGEDKESRDDKDFFAYRGIPYATAGRFEEPQPPKNWSGIREAEEYGKACIQYSTFEKKVVGAEDCLFVNVFTPKIGDTLLSKRLLPVMVFISGSFMEGTSELYRAHYFMDYEVVVVTFNYRVNVFGFLSTGDSILPGNLGLKDQLMALTWVKKNIRKFSGDPTKVTIFGAGDGATSVHLLMLSPLSKGLFKKAITQSGSALKVNVFQTHPKAAAARIARLMDCGNVLKNQNVSENSTHANIENVSDDIYANSSLILTCLKEVDAKKLAELQKHAFNLIEDPLTFFGPVIERPFSTQAFISEHPYSLISSGKQARVPWMAGINSGEGLIKTGVILNNKELSDKINDNWDNLSPQLLKYDWSRADITTGIRRFYLNSGNVSADPHPLTTTTPPLYPTLMTTPPQEDGREEEFRTLNFEEQFQDFTDLFTDRLYFWGVMESIHFQSRLSPVYFYYNNYQGEYSLLDVITGKSKEPTPALKKVSSWFKTKILGRTPQTQKHLGVCNGDELPLLFKYPDLKIKESSKDYEMSKKIVALWVQFATDETKMSFCNTTWRPIDPESLNPIMTFANNDQNSCGLNPLSNKLMARLAFWKGVKYLAPFDQ